MTFKKSFTLFEIIIVIILISVLYTFAIGSFTSKSKKNLHTITLMNLKTELLKFEYEKTIEIQCVEDDLSCFVFSDGVKQDDKISNLFHEQPIVYKYNQNQDKIEYTPLELEEMERYNIVFKYSCDNYGKCSEFIVEDGDDIYIFNDIKLKPIKYKYLGDIDDYFNKKIEEVKDAL